MDKEEYKSIKPKSMSEYVGNVLRIDLIDFIESLRTVARAAKVTAAPGTILEVHRSMRALREALDVLPPWVLEE